MAGRYLSWENAAAALQRGEAVAQFLGGGRSSEGATVRWIEISKDTAGKFVTRFIVALDEPGSRDIYAFPAEDPELPNGEWRAFGTEKEALDYAVESFGAAPERFVARGLVQAEYEEYRQRMMR